MANVIIADPDMLKFDNQIYGQEAVVLSNLHEVKYGENNIYVPSSLLADVQEKENSNIYFELENYPFFEKAIEIIGAQNKPKGVFRYRRITKTDKDESLLVEDIAVITALFGDPKSAYVKRTDNHVKPYHVIVTLNFGNGTMAHVEYTLANKNQIELEWNGIEQILEFNSDEMRPLISEDNKTTSLSLKIQAASILNKSYPVDQKLLANLEKCRKLLKDGVNR